MSDPQQLAISLKNFLEQFGLHSEPTIYKVNSNSYEIRFLPSSTPVSFYILSRFVERYSGAVGTLAFIQVSGPNGKYVGLRYAPSENADLPKILFPDLLACFRNAEPLFNKDIQQPVLPTISVMDPNSIGQNKSEYSMVFNNSEDVGEPMAVFRISGNRGAEWFAKQRDFFKRSR